MDGKTEISGARKIQGTPNNEHPAVPAMLPSHPSFWRSIHLSIHTSHLPAGSDSVTLKDSFTNLEQSSLRFSVTIKLPGISLISPSTSPFQPENTAGFWHLFRRPLSTRRHDLEAWAPKDSTMTGHVLDDTKPDDERANHGQYHEHKQYHDHHTDHDHHHHHHVLLLLSTTTLNPFINSKSSHPTNRRHQGTHFDTIIRHPCQDGCRWSSCRGHEFQFLIPSLWTCILQPGCFAF